MTLAVRGSPQWVAARMTVALAVQSAVAASRDDPAKMFWLHAIRCPGCHRHAVALGLSTNDVPRPKYVLYTIVNGEVIPRGLRH